MHKEIRLCCPVYAASYLECQPHILPLVPALASHREESPQRHRKNPRIQEFTDKNKTTRLTLASEPAHENGRLTVKPPPHQVNQSSRYIRKCDRRRSGGRERHLRGRSTRNGPTRVSLRSAQNRPRGRKDFTGGSTGLFENMD